MLACRFAAEVEATHAQEAIARMMQLTEQLREAAEASQVSTQHSTSLSVQYG